MRQTKVIKPKKSPKKFLLIGGVIVLLAAAAYTGIAKHEGLWPFSDKTAPADYSSQNGKTKDVSPKNTNTQTKTDSKATSISGDTTQQVPVDPTLTASITQLSESDGVITFNGKVTNATSAGTCVITFSNPNDRPVTKQFDATYKDSVAACGPTTISANEFSYLGNWQVSFHYYTDSQQATTEGTVNIQ